MPSPREIAVIIKKLFDTIFLTSLKLDLPDASLTRFTTLLLNPKSAKLSNEMMEVIVIHNPKRSGPRYPITQRTEAKTIKREPNFDSPEVIAAKLKSLILSLALPSGESTAKGRKRILSITKLRAAKILVTSANK